MTSRLLLAGYSASDMRDALRGAGAAEVLSRRGLTVSAACMPLFADRGDGGLAQAVRVTVHAEAEARLTVRLLQGGEPCDAGELTAGASRYLFVPEVSEPGQLTLEVSDATGVVGSGTVTVTPQRKWTVSVVHHSHLDIGYTDPQGVVLRHHLEYLDSVLDLAEQTADWPEPARFRWVVESALVVRRYLAARPESGMRRFVELAKSGQVEVTALPFQMHTEACSVEELHRQLWFADSLRERHGVPITSAMHTDVPGAVVGLVDALASAGVRYLSAAHNWAGRSVPYLHGGQHLERPFWWRSPAGNRLLVWFTDTPHGNAYMEGNVVGLAEDYELVLDLLPGYLHALANRPFPYGAEAFGWSGLPDEQVSKPSYRHDLLHLRVQGAESDNAGPSFVPASIVRQWNSTWAYPRLETATNTQFLARVEERLGAALPEHTGDWTDWWADGLGSGARPLGYARRAQHAVRHAETLHSLADLAGVHGGSAGVRRGSADDAVEAIYDKLGLFDEHTWGAADPWHDAEHGRGSGALQWARKSELAHQAADDAEDLRRSGLHRFGSSLGRPPGALASYLVLNPGPAARTDVAEAFLPDSVVPLDRPVTVVDARSGEVVPHHEEVVSRLDSPARPAGRRLLVGAADVPPSGYVRFDVHDGDAFPVVEPLGSDGVLENEHYRVEVDLRTGVVASIFDKQAGRELVNGDAAAGLNQYVHDTYGTAPHTNHLSGMLTAQAPVGRQRPALLTGRSVGRQPWVVRSARTSVGEFLELALTGDGIDGLRTTISLAAGVRRVDIVNRLDKQGTAGKQSVFFAFPFAAPAPVAWELTGGVGGSGVATVPGAASHLKPLRHWVGFADGDLATAWATLQAPLVMIGDLYLPYAPFPRTVDPQPAEPGTVYSWAMNNIWDTNFPGQQQGETTFQYAISSGSGVDPRQLGARTAAGLTDPFLAIPVGGGADSPANELDSVTGGGAHPPASHQFVSVSDPRVQVSSIARSRRGHDLVVYLRSLTGETVDVDVRLAFDVRSASATGSVSAAGSRSAVRAAFAGTSLERDLRPLAVRDDGAVRVPVPAGNLVALTLNLAPK